MDPLGTPQSGQERVPPATCEFHGACGSSCAKLWPGMYHHGQGINNVVLRELLALVLLWLAAGGQGKTQ